jgi:mono/diheme cytochrome c family protein
LSDKQEKRIAEQRARENADPDEGIKPLPWFLVMALGAMAMWGAFYIYVTPSGVDSAYGDQRTISTLRPPDQASDGAIKVDGKQLFNAKCAACHQATGLGIAGAFPPLAGAEWVVGEEKILTNILLHGVVGVMEVKGVKYQGVMPAWKTLSDDELSAVLTYIRSAWGNTAPPLTAATIKAQRELTKDRSQPYNGGQELGSGSK